MGKRLSVVLRRLAAFLMAWAVLAMLPQRASLRPATALLPLWLLLAFGLHSAVVVLYSVATFPSCPEAALGLQRVRSGYLPALANAAAATERLTRTPGSAGGAERLGKQGPRCLLAPTAGPNGGGGGAG